MLEGQGLEVLHKTSRHESKVHSVAPSGGLVGVIFFIIFPSAPFRNMF